MLAFSYLSAFSPSAAKIARAQASSLTVEVEYNSASVDRSNSSKPRTKRSGSLDWESAGMIGTSGGSETEIA